MQFLDEIAALSAIQTAILEASEARIAVAFWGDNAVKTLGLKRPGLTVRAICNLESGACNPAELRRLAPLAEGGLLSDPRLHAKVYWTRAKVILGSSNASANGLAVEGDELRGWAEANVLVTDPSLIAEIAEWFDRRAEAASIIGDDEFAIAEQVWKSRQRTRPTGTRLTGSLIAAYRMAPDRPHWRRVKFAFCSDDVDAAGRKDAREQIDANGALGDYGYYQDWQHQFSAGDWIVECDPSGRRPRLEGYYQVPNPKIEGRCVTFVRKVQAISLPGLPRLRLGDEEISAVHGIRRALLKEHGDSEERNAVVEISTVVEFLDRAATRSPDVSAFGREMRRIYDEAREIGYRPTRYLEMLNTLGGLGTAKQLLRPGPPSDGFVSLVMLNRQDLAVEALALDERWSGLFTEDELRVARARLGRDADTRPGRRSPDSRAG